MLPLPDLDCSAAGATIEACIKATAARQGADSLAIMLRFTHTSCCAAAGAAIEACTKATAAGQDPMQDAHGALLSLQGAEQALGDDPRWQRLPEEFR